MFANLHAVPAGQSLYTLYVVGPADGDAVCLCAELDAAAAARPNYSHYSVLADEMPDEECPVHGGGDELDVLAGRRATPEQIVAAAVASARLADLYGGGEVVGIADQSGGEVIFDATHPGVLPIAVPAPEAPEEAPAPVLYLVRPTSTSGAGSVGPWRRVVEPIRDALQRDGMRSSEVADLVADLDAGHVLTADNGREYRRATDAEARGTIHAGLNRTCSAGFKTYRSAWAYLARVAREAGETGSLIAALELRAGLAGQGPGELAGTVFGYTVHEGLGH